MTIPLTIRVFCEQCISKTDEFGSDSDTEMISDGPLYFNPETKSQIQDYKCPTCNHEITVVLSIEEQRS